MDKQPPELLDTIAGNIDSREDLLSFALASKQLYQIAALRHLGLRDIHCKLTNVGVWKVLSTNTSLAESVRRIRILRQTPRLGHPEEDEHIPKEIQAAVKSSKSAEVDDLEAEKLFIAALKKTKNLTAFKWDRKPPPVINAGFDGAKEDIWTILAGIKTLRELNVADVSDSSPLHNPHTAIPGFARPIHDSEKFYELSGLTSINYATYAYKDSDTSPDMKGLEKMLRRNQDLETLVLWFALWNNQEDDSADINSLFAPPQAGKPIWPKLKKLTLDAITISQTSAAEFLAAHPSIETLRVPKKFGGLDDEDYPLPEGTLPNLTNIRAPIHMVLSILNCPTTSPRPVEILSGIDFSDKIDFNAYFSPFDTVADESAAALNKWKEPLLKAIANYPTLERLYLDHAQSVKDLALIGKAAPQLKWLTAPHVVEGTDMPAFLEALKTLPNLEVLHGFVWFDNSSSVQKNTGVFRKMLASAPKLRRLTWHDMRPGVWVVVILRDNEGGKLSKRARWVVRRVLEDIEIPSDDEQVHQFDV